MYIVCTRHPRKLIDDIKVFGSLVSCDDETINSLICYADELNKIGQNPKEWFGDYIDGINLGSENLDEDGREQRMTEMTDKRWKWRQEYINYATEKYKYR